VLQVRRDLRALAPAEAEDAAIILIDLHHFEDRFRWYRDSGAEEVQWPF
jgi:hypothetical protein